MSLLRNILLALALTAGGTIGSGCVPTQVAVTATTPRLVWVAPGVWVVEDYPWAVYYMDGYYWRYRGGLWYRSSWYDDGFARVDFAYVPPMVRRVHRPNVYVRYHARPGTRVRVIDHRTRQPIVREHRDQRRPAPPHAPRR